MSFGTQLFPHHDDSCSQQFLCEVEPLSREVIFIDGEPLPATTKEHYVGDSTIGKPDCFEDPKDTITSSGGFYLNTTGLNRDPALIALSTSTSDGEQTILENIAAGYTQDVYPQALPDPPPYIPPVPSNSPNETMMAVAKDATQACGTKSTWPHVLHIDLVKIDGFAQGINPLWISCTTKLITLLLALYAILTPFPFDRGKMVSSLPLLPLCSLIADPIKALSSKPYASISTPMEGIRGRLLLSGGPLLPMGSDHMHMGSDNMHWLYLAQAPPCTSPSKHSEHMQPNPTWI